MSYRFIYSTTTGAQDIINIDSPDSSFATAHANGNFQWQESAQPNYKAFLYQFVNAGYTNINLKPNKSWDILAGVRAENNISITRYKEITDNINEINLIALLKIKLISCLHCLLKKHLIINLTKICNKQNDNKTNLN